LTIETGMARQANDREDLLAEAKALVERIHLQAAGLREAVTVGFRRDHSASFYFGPQHVYQFNSAGSLRRAFVDDLLYKADRGRLVSLRRERGPELVALVRHDLEPAETVAFFDTMRGYLETLHHSLAKQHFTVMGQVPGDADLIARVCCWVDEFAGKSRIAASPRVA
jgi:hypothetical protein